MRIRFRIHDRATYPDGAVLDVPMPPDVLRAALRDGADGIPVADVTLRTRHDVGYGNVWLAEPSLDALEAELDRLEAIRDDLEARREQFIAKVQARREQ